MNSHFNLSIKKNPEFYKKLLSIAIPVTISNLVSSSLSLVDNVMIGQLDASHISATGLANQITFVLLLLTFGINSGTCIFVAQYWGKREESKIRNVVAISYMLSGLSSLLFFGFAFFFSSPIMGFLTVDPRVVELGGVYLKIIAPSFLFHAITAPLLFSTRSIGNARIGMYASTASLIINTILNYALIFGKLGLPEMGIAGAALATLIARMIEALIMVAYIRLYIPTLRISWSDFTSIPKDMLRNVLRKASPVIANEGLWSLGMSAMTLIYARISTGASAAFFIADTIRMIFTVLSFGVGNASAVMLGNALGEGKKELAVDYNKKFLLINTLLGIIMGAMVFILAPIIVLRLYDIEAEVAMMAIASLRVIGTMLPFKFFNIVMIIGTFRAGGDTVYSMLLEATGVWGVGVPAAYLAGLAFGLPVPLVVLASNMDEVFKFFVGIPRILSNKWAKTLV